MPHNSEIKKVAGLYYAGVVWACPYAGIYTLVSRS
jgi:hypothetical protein